MPLDVEVVNVGPICRAQLSPRNLNVLIGPNDTGKTFFATVMHRLFASKTEAYYPDHEPAEYIPEGIRNYVEQILSLPKPNDGQANYPELSIDDHMRVWANDINASTLQRFGYAVRRGISYAYGTPITFIRRQPISYSADSSYILVNNSNPTWSLKIPMEDSDDIDNIIVESPDPDAWINEVYSPDRIQDYSTHFVPWGSSVKDADIDPILQVEQMSQSVLYMTGDTELFHDWPNICLHLPSERGGIMQSYRAIASAALRRSYLAGIEPIEIEPLDGTSRDFLSFVVSPERNLFRPAATDTYLDSASTVERKMRAEIDIVKGGTGIDRVIATTPEGKFEFNQTSSMISEISALIIALKYRLNPDDYLTIDEPEAHLHPEMQIAIASLLVDLASRGLTLTVTTHSDYFVEQINNAIRASALASDSNSVEEIQNRQLRFEDVRALLFDRGQDGCTAAGAMGDIVDPISEETFTMATRRQYEESLQLVKSLLERGDTTKIMGQ